MRVRKIILLEEFHYAKQIAVLGYGVVGSGVVELFYQNQEKIEKNTGYPMDIKYILDLRTFEGDPYADKVVHDINVILQDPEVGYVAECMGGVNPAFEFVSSCLKAGKSVGDRGSSAAQSPYCEGIGPKLCLAGFH